MLLMMGTFPWQQYFFVINKFNYIFPMKYEIDGTENEKIYWQFHGNDPLLHSNGEFWENKSSLGEYLSN
jgi:hypothetical protein